MPSTAQKTTGSPLKNRFGRALEMTARDRESRAQKEASKTEKSEKSKRAPEKRTARAAGIAEHRRTIIIVVAAIVVVVAILYPAARTYYQSVRDEQRLQAQVEAVNAYNEAVQAENEALQTEEGIENQAREDLGLVKEGEQEAIVTNEQGGASNTSKLPEKVDESKITAPKTWYYSILDAIFFVDG